MNTRVLIMVSVGALFHCLFFYHKTTQASVQSKAPAKYLFFQQFDDMCTIAPMLNRHRLQELRALGDDYIDQAFRDPSRTLTRQQWFGESYEYLFSWRKFLTHFMHSKVGKDYLTQAGLKGIVIPHVYDEKGVSYFKKSKIEAARFPYFFADLSSEEITEEMDTSFVIPLVSIYKFTTEQEQERKRKKIIESSQNHDLSGQQDMSINFLSYIRNSSKQILLSIRNYLNPIPEKSKKSYCFPIDTSLPNKDFGWLMYNKDKKQFLPFSYQELETNKDYLAIKSSLHSYDSSIPGQQFNYQTRKGEGSLGFRSFLMPHDSFEHGFKENNSSSEKMPYSFGLLKIMFLVLGIDNNNNPITEDNHDEYRVHEEMKQLIQVDSATNPWSDQFFKKEHFIQYTLANILKNNQELYDKAVKVVDITGMGLWKTYDDIISGRLIVYKDRHLTPYDSHEVAQYLPGRHQALATFFTQALRLLWYGALSKNGIGMYKSLGIYDAQRPLLSRFNAWRLGISFAQLKHNAQKERDNVSFLSIWKELKTELMKNSMTTDWISFDGHGWVISFDQYLIDKQKNIAEKKDCDYEFFSSLGIAGIDSWISKEVESFYKQ